MSSIPEQPNIILVNADDLGYGDLGCYGSTVNDTPNLDRLADEGTRFTDFYMASPVCSPSRGAMMTGCYPPRIGFDVFEGKHWVLFPGHSEGLSAAETTVATLLKGQGYATKIIGKWHCGDQPEFLPTRHGFDSYFGLPYSNDMGRQRDQRETQPPPLPLLHDENVIEQQPDMASLTARYVQESLRFMREQQARPFFLYLAHMHVHLPHIVPQFLLDRSRNDRYGAAVANIDWAMGMLLHELQRLGLERKTLVIFTSDNGSRGDHGGSNAPLRGRKGSTWEGGQRVPCLAWWPGRVPAGRVCGEVVTGLDFLPTFARLAGTAAPTDRIIDGCDVSSVLLGEPDATSPRETFFYFMRDQLEAVRDGRWKLHVSKRGTPMCELYDLADDIAETQNLAEQHPDIVRQLQERLAACREDLGDAVTGTVGKNRRPVGKVANPQPLTMYDPTYPYFAAEYDLPDRG